MEPQESLVMSDIFIRATSLSVLVGGVVGGTTFLNSYLEENKTSPFAATLFMGMMAAATGTIIGIGTGIMMLVTAPVLLPVVAGTLAYRYITDDPVLPEPPLVNTRDQKE